MTCPFIEAVKDSQWHRAKLVRVAKYMRQSERWRQAPIDFPALAPVSGEIEWR